jgi:hypothetical protein
MIIFAGFRPPFPGVGFFNSLTIASGDLTIAFCVAGKLTILNGKDTNSDGNARTPIFKI